MKLLDLFAGTGVGVAAHQLGIPEFGVEIWEPAFQTRETVGFQTPYRDVWDIEKAEALNFDAMWASPPCQTFSVAGKGAGRRALDDVILSIGEERWRSIDSLRSLGDEVGDARTALVLTPLAYAHRYRPRTIALEQVPTVLPVWQAYVDPLEKMGYSVWTGYLHAEQYGVPQTRKRAYLIARLDGEANPPRPTHSKYYSRSPKRLDPGVKKWVSMAEALGWGMAQRPNVTLGNACLRAEGVGGTGARVAIHAERDRGDWMGGWNYPMNEGEASASQSYPEWAFNRPATTVVGSFRPEVIAAPGYRTKGGPSRQNAPGSYVSSVDERAELMSYPRVEAVKKMGSGMVERHGDRPGRPYDHPAFTIRGSAGGTEPGGFVFRMADGSTEKMVNEESASLQSYIAPFPFQGSRSQVALQIGNAVPPMVARAVLEALMEE